MELGKKHPDVELDGSAAALELMRNLFALVASSKCSEDQELGFGDQFTPHDSLHRSSPFALVPKGTVCTS